VVGKQNRVFDYLYHIRMYYICDLAIFTFDIDRKIPKLIYSILYINILYNNNIMLSILNNNN